MVGEGNVSIENISVGGGGNVNLNVMIAFDKKRFQANERKCMYHKYYVLKSNY